MPKRHCLPRWMVEIFSSVLVQTGDRKKLRFNDGWDDGWDVTTETQLLCVLLLEGNLAKCDVSYTHFTILLQMFMLFSWWFHDSSKRIFYPDNQQSFTLGFQRASYGNPSFDILEYLLIPVIVLNMKWSYVKKNIHISWKWAPTGFDEAPPTIYQRDWHKWYKIHDTLRIGRFQNWWFSRSQKNPPKTPSIGGSNRWLMPPWRCSDPSPAGKVLDFMDDGGAK